MVGTGSVILVLLIVLKGKEIFINTTFLQPCFAEEFFPITKIVPCRKNKICVKLIYSTKITSFFSKFLVKLLKK